MTLPAIVSRLTARIRIILKAVGNIAKNVTVIQTLTILIQRMTQMNQNQRKLIYLILMITNAKMIHNIPTVLGWQKLMHASCMGTSAKRCSIGHG